MPKAHRGRLPPDKCQASFPDAEAEQKSLAAAIVKVSDALQECGNEAHLTSHHWQQLRKSIITSDTSASPAWLQRVRSQFCAFAGHVGDEITADDVAAQEQLAGKARIRQLEENVAQVTDAAMLAQGEASTTHEYDLRAIAQLEAETARLQAELVQVSSSSRSVDKKRIAVKDQSIVELNARLGRKHEEVAVLKTEIRECTANVENLLREKAEQSALVDQLQEEKEAAEAEAINSRLDMQQIAKRAETARRVAAAERIGRGRVRAEQNIFADQRLRPEHTGRAVAGTPTPAYYHAPRLDVMPARNEAVLRSSNTSFDPSLLQRKIANIRARITPASS
ncbi:hypothetical protein Slin15195_G049440 [Septoria linicola]|uniref:Uncharacterized protein n=1 Tax=Septoria linicola TaxID=215465 RepID=A0A9Q9AS96_9PEZI|nr:hypothetical protein Slin15195_G049440 [Septoria linicola]